MNALCFHHGYDADTALFSEALAWWGLCGVVCKGIGRRSCCDAYVAGFGGSRNQLLGSRR